MPNLPIETKRLHLRPLTEDDADAVFAILGDATTTAAVSWRQPDIDATRRWVWRRLEQQRQFGLSMWAVELRDSGALVGLAGFFPHDEATIELGYVVHARYWRRGIATEAVSAVLSLVAPFRDSVFATVRSTNESSLAVAQRVGLVESDRLEDSRGTLIVMRLAPAGK